jgi:biotin-dependent carboxylase-like uncharacterized protein
MTGFTVIQPGILSLLQDHGRYGHHSIGLTTGGPIDNQSFQWANRLCHNSPQCAAIEVTIGGLVLEANISTSIAVTGAAVPLSINKQPAALWQTHRVQAGDRIELGFAPVGSRSYLAVAAGFQASPSFGSQSTVPREGLGGLHQDGTPLGAGDQLPCLALEQQPPCHRLAEAQQPTLSTDNSAHCRVVLGYQQQAFSAVQQQLFFSSTYKVTDSSDRMGYRLNGPAIKPAVDGILSEGICLGAIQVPADGQPIVLLADRQTIGGYPKIGSVLSLDLGKLAQVTPGGTVSFEAISIEQAHNLLALNQRQLDCTEFGPVAGGINEKP